MAEKTHSRSGRPPSEGAPVWHGDPTQGADLIAPTAPHARPSAEEPEKLSGPAKFWSVRRVRTALFVATAISLCIHWYLTPWRLLPSSSGIELKDPGGELAIPVDFITDEPPAPATPPPPAPVEPPPVPVEKATDPNAPAAHDAGPPKKPKDAGVPLAVDLDAGALDASDESDASTLFTDGGVALAEDGGSGAPGAHGPRDPASMFGLSKVVNTGTVNVVLGVNIAVIRKHPVGGRIGPVLAAIPQWRDFLKGAQQAVDPIQDVDWILIYGPSLIHTEKDAVLVKYNASDAAMDRAIEGITKLYDKHGTFESGVPGIRGTLGYADNAVRAFMRPQSHLLVIVPESHTREAAQVFSKQTPKGPPPKEAMRLVVKNPSNQIAIRGLKFASSITEIRLWIVPRDNDAGPDGGADIYAEGDCTEEEACADSADKLTEVIKNQNSIGVRIATRGIFNNAKVLAEGKKLKLHVEANQEQLEAVLQLVAAAVNVNVPPPPGAGGAAIPPANPNPPGGYVPPDEPSQRGKPR